jgi:hypothetical protein
MTTLVIEENSVQARQFVKYVRTLPFVTVKGEEASANGAALNEVKPAGRLSDMFRGVLSAESGDSFNAHIKTMREEWDDI